MSCFGPNVPDVGGFCRRCLCWVGGLVFMVVLLLMIGWWIGSMKAAALAAIIVLPFVVIDELLRVRVMRHIKEGRWYG